MAQPDFRITFIGSQLKPLEDINNLIGKTFFIDDKGVVVEV